MTQQKRTKKALLASGLSLLACVALLLGTTFAWFTDSVTSGRNQITAGNLDVELYVRDDAGSYQPVNENEALFDDAALWEPGHTEVVYLKVENVGTLALKYQLTVTVAGETAGTNVDGETFNLSDYLVFGQAVGATETIYNTRAAAQTAAGEQMGLNDYTKPGNLVPGEEEYIALVVYMPENVDNKANYKTGTTAPSIELGVDLVATQDTVESDSFGTDYDADAWVGTIDTSWYNAAENEWNISKPAQLAGLAKLVNEGTSFTGKTITLTADIDLNHIAWTPIGNNMDGVCFDGTFNGGGYTISNLKVSRANVATWTEYRYKNTYNYAGLFGAVCGTIQNLVLENCSVEVSDSANSRRGDVYAGVLAGVNFGTISNVSVSNSTVNATAWLVSSAGAAVGSNVGTVTQCEADGVTVYALSEGWTANAGGVVGASGDRLYWNQSAKVTDSKASNCNVSANVTDEASITDIDYPSQTTYFGRVYCGGIGGLAVNTTAAGNQAENNHLAAQSYAEGDYVLFQNEKWGYGASD